MAQTLGLSERVKLIGFRGDIPELYKAADLYVHPSYREGLPVSLVEAAASGLPCVASRIRGCVDVLPDTEHVFCDPADPRTFAASIRAFASDAGLREATAARNIRHVKQFGIDNVEKASKAIWESMK
jgi:glycosyltransferase involved in cell wall biosynthesis